MRQHRKGSLRTPIALAFAAIFTIPAAGCGGDSAPTGPGGPGGPGQVSGQIVYSRARNVSGEIIPVLAESGSGFDRNEVDSPAIAVDSGRPGGDKFLLYYEAVGTQGTVIGLVSSAEEDLLPLTIGRTLVVGTGAPASGYSFAATDPTVLVDKRPAEAAERYKMWFEGRSGTTGQTSTILYGTSADGVTWSSFTPCTGLTAAFASVRVADPCVILQGDTYKMWFEAINTTNGADDGPGRIGYAESADGIAWVIEDAAGNTGPSAGPVFSPGSAAFDAYSVNAPSVVHDPAASPAFHMWYEAGDQAGDVLNTIGYATSSNGLTWSRASLPVLAPSSDLLVPLPFDSGDLEHPAASIDASIPAGTEGHFLLWYTGDSEGSATPNRIGLAKGYKP
ncbi:MAG: hypothetical protein OEX18_13005 [Candidatus Krumholzibacteria bacterium]|nr:hypothetical protein [Candidatus Krumholzibacteria bacterium]MDH4338184.1 hypothetical protein [Candidatus Krumholzibacteria bacterium]MDH5269827.1 hypothetical protein [Candidatus Krumholzibacteria bacterium]